MDGVIVLDTEKCGLADNKTKGDKMTKGSTIGSVPRKKLADISNLQQWPKPSNQDANPHQNISLSTKEYIDKLHKENMMLMKVLADRNKIIELSGIELQKLRINLQKVQQQNLQLAQANSQMLAELNSGRDRLKALQHELGCKNGLLKATKLVLEEKAKTVTCQVSGNEVGTTECNEAAEFLHADKGDNKPCNTNRRRQSKNQILGPSTVKPVQAKEKVDNKRRRQSARFKSEEQEPTEDLFEIPSTVEPVQPKEKVDNKRRRQSARFKSEELEPTEDLFEIDESKNQNLGPSTVKPVRAKEKVDSKRRRQSARFKSEEPEPTEDMFEIDDLGPSTVKPVQAKEKVEDKRRRQSARFKSEEPEPTEDRFEIDDANFPVSLCDELAHDNGPTSSIFSVQKEHEKANSVPRDEAQEFRRTSVGRPLRRAAEKVQSYKEIPVNIKMRRPE